ncbi:MAG: hypothetical protein SXQ77_05820, partial [Halobacteria archaeon]|nr:hypothetical protein [Halobacteria archaeon]
TVAFLSDYETYTNNQLVAGELDMLVNWQESYNGAPQEAFPDSLANQNGNVIPGSDGVRDVSPLDVDNPCTSVSFTSIQQETPVIDIEGVDSGDVGRVSFGLTLCTNPGYVWFQGDEVEQVNEGDIDIADAVQVRLWYDDNCDNAVDGTEEVFYEGSLTEALGLLSTDNGIPLDADTGTPYDEVVDGNNPDVGDGDNPDRECFDTATPFCVGFEWEVPDDVPDEDLNGYVTFDLGFYTEQCRHNTGVGMAPEGGTGNNPTGSP